MSRPPNRKQLIARNETLRSDVALLQNALETKRENLELQASLTRLQAHNGLSDLANMARVEMSNLTSFNPMFQNTIFAPITINYTELGNLYASSGLIRAAISGPVDDAFKKGLNVSSGEAGKDVKDLTDRMEEDGAISRIKQASKWTRLFGGGALVMNCPDGKGGHLVPLDVDRVKKGADFRMYAANRWELGGTQRVPIEGYFTYRGVKMDPSRVLTICGEEAPWPRCNLYQGWGMSEVEHMIPSLNTFLRNMNVIYELLEDAKIDVYLLEGLAAQIVSPDGQARTFRRLQNMNALKNYNRAVVLDKNDSFEQKQVTFSGLAEMVRENRIQLCCDLRQPMSKLFGTTAGGSGLANSGQDDLENYNAMVVSSVREPLRPACRQVLNMYAQVVWGARLELAFDYYPLREMSALDEETVKDRKNTRLQGWYDRRVVDSHEVGQAIAKDQLLSVATKAEKGELDPFPAGAELMDQQGGTDGEGQGEADAGRSGGRRDDVQD
ncbi:MAG: DUF1073 domain-containing protein [Elusimicrobia bacterium]|nr:DUF1073 domain-containing protein [Elusimicrobiota bacterium]